MKMNLKSMGASFSVVALLAAGVGMASCSTEEVDPDESGGSAGEEASDNTGGEENEDGTGGASESTGGNAGEATTSTGGAGGDGGAPAAATGGSAGASALECEEKPACTENTCTGADPGELGDPLLTDWEDVGLAPDFTWIDSDAWGGGADGPASWWTGVFGGPYVYPDCRTNGLPEHVISRTVDNGALVVTGTVGTYAGIGIWMEPCWIDMSAYSGISFKISGDAGPSGELKMTVFFAADTAPVECRSGRGTCDPDAGECVNPNAMVPVTDTEETITLSWTDFTGGLPEDGVDPAKVWQLQWDFAWAGDADTPYPVNVVIDDLTLVE